MYCYNCASVIEDESSFCRGCGAETAIVADRAEAKPGTAVVGQFLLGAVIFVTVLIALISILSTFFPTIGSPQLTALILLLLGAVVSGYCMVLIKRDRLRPRRVDKTKMGTELEAGQPLQLPHERVFSVPDSVTATTTQTLKVR
ncbi:hypothetical protein BH20ACI2_BH20ACI2_09530 [soil metagenome]